MKSALSRSLCGSLHMPGSSFTMHLDTSCKSQQPPTSVNFRNIHSAPCHSFAGLAIGQRNNTETRLHASRGGTKTLATSSGKFLNSNHWLNIALYEWTLSRFSLVVSQNFLAWTQVVHLTRVQGHDCFTTSTTSFLSPTS